MFLRQATVGGLVDGREHGVVQESLVFFAVGVEPDSTVGMGRLKGRGEARGARMAAGGSGDMRGGAQESG